MTGTLTTPLVSVRRWNGAAGVGVAPPLRMAASLTGSDAVEKGPASAISR
jgi:hypothetical protein